MPNKKTLKRNKRNSKRSRGRNRKGGFFGLFEDKHNETDTACDSNNLANLTDFNSMHANYQTCCPKTWYGRKNNSPYCKQLDSKFNAQQNTANMDAKFNKQLITSTFTEDGDNGITVDVPIDCKTPSLYNTKEEIQEYIKSCKCDNLSWYNINGKKNCGIVKTTLEKLNENQIAEERPTEVFNPIQQNNGYMPVNQNDIQNEEQERDTEVTNPIYLQEAQNQRSSFDDIPDKGCKRRKTKKHFNKRSIKKRNGRNSKRRKH